MRNFNSRLFFSSASAPAACRRENELELSMVHRPWLGDLSFAVLIAMPIASLALPLPIAERPTTSAAKMTSTDGIAATGRISLLG
jgi:hypothetical protein